MATKLTYTLDSPSVIDASDSPNADDVSLANIRILATNNTPGPVGISHIDLLLRTPKLSGLVTTGERKAVLTRQPRSIRPVTDQFNAWEIRFDSERTAASVGTTPDGVPVVVSKNSFRASPLPGQETVLPGTTAEVTFELRDVQVIDQDGETLIDVEETLASTLSIRLGTGDPVVIFLRTGTAQTAQQVAADLNGNQGFKAIATAEATASGVKISSLTTAAITLVDGSAMAALGFTAGTAVSFTGANAGPFSLGVTASQDPPIKIRKAFPALAIQSFLASELVVRAGQSVTLSWLTRGASELVFDGFSVEEADRFRTAFALTPEPSLTQTVIQVNGSVTGALAGPFTLGPGLTLELHDTARNVTFSVPFVGPGNNPLPPGGTLTANAIADLINQKFPGVVNLDGSPINFGNAGSLNGAVQINSDTLEIVLNAAAAAIGFTPPPPPPPKPPSVRTTSKNLHAGEFNISPRTTTTYTLRARKRESDQPDSAADVPQVIQQVTVSVIDGFRIHPLEFDSRSTPRILTFKPFTASGGTLLMLLTGRVKLSQGSGSLDITAQLMDGTTQFSSEGFSITNVQTETPVPLHTWTTSNTPNRSLTLSLEIHLTNQPLASGGGGLAPTIDPPLDVEIAAVAIEIPPQILSARST